jgi:hypothetical protein
MTAVAGTAGQFLRRNTANTAYEFRTLQGGDIAGSELTKSDDTNVTISLGGTPASALLQPVSLTLGWTGQLAVSRGGTGASTLTGVLIGNGTSAVTAITGTANQILRRNSGNTAYEFWSANYLVNPMTLEGSIIYATTGGTPAELFANSTGTRKYLSQINGTAPTWEALPASVGGSGTTNYVSKWTSSTTLGDSQIYDNGTNVGIGTATPTTGKLQINTGSASNNALVIEADTVTSRKYGIGMTSTGGLNFYDNTAAASRLFISSAGYIGINTALPSYNLDVSGTARFTGNVLASNVINLIGAENNSAKIKAGKFLSIADDGNLVGINYTSDSIPLAGFLLSINGDTYNHGNLTLRSTYNLTWGGAYGTDIPTISGTSGSGSNGFLQFYPAGSTSGVKMALRRTGQLALPSYTSSSAFTGTSVATLAVDAAGDVITIAPQQTTASGTYTPTWTGLSNVDSVTSFSSQYMRVGDTVTVSGWVTINATVDNTATSLSFSLPINSDTSVVNRLNGTGVQQGGGVAACLSGYGTNFGEFEVLPSVDTAVNYSFHFTYRIV